MIGDVFYERRLSVILTLFIRNLLDYSYFRNKKTFLEPEKVHFFHPSPLFTNQTQTDHLIFYWPPMGMFLRLEQFMKAE